MKQSKPYQIPVFVRICGILLLFLQTSLACSTPINIHSGSNVALSKILEEIASICHLNVIYLQEQTKTMLDSKKTSIHINNKPLIQVLDSLLKSNDFHYTLQKDTLQVGFLLTKTFEISYIATTRVGSSNTDIVFSQDNQTHSPYNTHTNAPLGFSNFEIESQAHKMAMNKATSNTQTMGKSGTKIYSIDEIDFWGELQNEIAGVAYAPGDSYQPTTSELKNKKDIIINKAAGLLTITATPKQIKRVESYLATLNNKIQKQVLIDVYIFNIQHSNNQTYGIDWNEFYKLGNLLTLPPNAEGSNNALTGVNNGDFAISIFSQGVSINRIVEFLQTYGKVQSVSNPKVLTLNNQPAIISVGSVLRYFQNTTYQTTTQGTSIQNLSQAFPSVFAGILLDVTPSVKNDKIILKINPSITKTKDISIENQTTALESPPNLSTKQLSSLVQVKDGEKIVLGGLIDKTEGQILRKLPILGDIPLLKYLFSYKKNIKETQEMVIIISPHIVRLGTARQEQDKIEEIINFTKESDFKPQDSKNTTKDSAPQDPTKQDSSTDTDTDSTPQNKQDSTQSLEAPLESKPNKQDSALSQPLAYKTDSPIPPHKAHI
ncbi:pilus (MSHA type) biogenesis protein MshL [Helicobacter magdeburgensis]|uniref:Pilus (MSHA type) biogenesis protein MshL n=1 Tax=Helicobacter magdeburgensis TaxID=471858 RepID=A0A4U8T126_9HELI|nr:pilus (MSHA type) biogenesis protein MshL [Helicobacter magdeburgensis]TLD93071.1 pilus (MSHA type) biogenesis protein MshL [Helicobacter magdeburgensis]